MRRRVAEFLRNIVDFCEIRFQNVYCENEQLVIGMISNGSTNEVDKSSPLTINKACIINGKTQYESTNNHYHLYIGRIRKKDYSDFRDISITLGKNLLSKLQKEFPMNNFTVYVEISIKNGIIIRFHQMWKDEKLVYTESDIKRLESNPLFKVYSFSSNI